MFIGDNKHVNNICTKNDGTERQWLLTECEGGPGETAKVTDISWTWNQIIAGPNNNFCKVFSRNSINFMLLI